MNIVIILSGLLLIAGIVERALHMVNVRRVPVRVLVNGTRGKTSVTRLLAAALREAGIRTWAKSTGSTAAIIREDGSEQPLKRPRGARLTEQLPFFRLCAHANAEAVVIECMAVRPESQRTMADLVRPTLVLITNARVDHVDEIGATERQTLRTLSLSIPNEAKLISPEAGLTELGFAPSMPDALPLPDGYLESFGYPVFEDNIRLVLAAASALGVDRETALLGMRRALPDIGMDGPFTVGRATVINAFAANDVLSASQLLQATEARIGIQDQTIRVLFNNRADREYRVQAFLPLLMELKPRIQEISVIGDYPAKIARVFARKTGIASSAGDAMHTTDQPGIVLCLGNIKGAGAQFVQSLRDLKEG